jgi:hypothetical protein
MTSSEAVTLITRELKALSSNFVADDYTDAIATAQRELSPFVFPTTNDFQILWLIKRTKRALFFALLSENLLSFKFKQLSLQDKFKNLKAIIEDMDAEFVQAMIDYADKFANVSAFNMFSQYVENSFKYTSLGQDITFNNDNLVGFHPNEED